MARGKGGLSSNVVLVTTRRRAASVPAEPITLGAYSSGYSPASYRRAQRISHNLTDDSDTIKSASRGKDQRLLDNVNQTLASAAFTQPVTVRRSRSRPPSAPRRPGGSGGGSGGGCARRVAAVKRRQVEEDEDVAFPEFRLPGRRGAPRAHSLPPTPVVRTASVHTGFIDNKSPLMRVADDFRVGSSNPYSASAHTSPFQQFVLSQEVPPPKAPRTFIPERPVYVAKTRSARGVSEPPQKRANYVADQAVRRAREALGRVEREYGSSGGGGGLYDYDDYDVEDTVIRPATYTPVRSTASTGFMRTGAAPVITRRAVSRPPTAPVRVSLSPSRSSRLAEIEARMEAQTMSSADPVISYNSLRSRTNDARSKMDTHRVMMDRYLPVYMGPVNDVQNNVNYKFGELQERMPSLQPYRPSRDVSQRAASVPPYRPPPSPTGGDRTRLYGDSLRIQPFKPTMSDTRRRCREVLCKTKRDPHYFDY